MVGLSWFNPQNLQGIHHMDVGLSWLNPQDFIVFTIWMDSPTPDLSRESLRFQGSRADPLYPLARSLQGLKKPLPSGKTFPVPAGWSRLEVG